MGEITEIAHEVNVLCDFNTIDNTKEKKRLSKKPTILTFGFLAIKNYKIKCKERVSEDNCPSFGYFIMSHYQYNLADFLKDKRQVFFGGDYVDLIFVITKQLIRCL